MDKWVKEVIIAVVATDYRWTKELDPGIDVEFWRTDGTYKEYENVSRKNFRNLTRALKDIRSASAETCADVLTIHFTT